MITLTSDSANKLLKKLEVEKQTILNEISDLSVYVAAVTENPEELKPEFDFNKSMKDVEVLNRKMISIRHARNIFNSETEIKPGMTIDEALIKMAMLNKYANDIYRMSTRQPKSRVKSIGYSQQSKEIEYQYINYDVTDAKNKYEEITNEIADIQEKLNLVNTTQTFEVDIDI